MRKRTFLIILISLIIIALEFISVIFFDGKKIFNLSDAEEITTIDLTGLNTGEDVVHTCIFEKKYNNSTHWEECFICHKKRNNAGHSLVTTGRPGCAVGYGYQSQYCSKGCGYSKTLPKQSHTSTGWQQDSTRNSHYTSCTVCGNQLRREPCRNSSGQLLGCATGIRGTCATCGLNYSSIVHTANLDYGNCNGCGVTIVSCTTSKQIIGAYTTRVT